MSRESRVSRRSLVAGGLATAVAAVTLPEAAASATPEVVEAAGSRGSRTITFSLTNPAHIGQRAKGSATLAHARLLDHAGAEVGTLRASGVHADTGGVGALRGNLTTQVLELGHDTLVGIGIGHHQMLDGTYAIVAGTGKFVGASGSYIIRDGSVHVSLLGS